MQTGRLDEAAERITARQYDVYEGGEGRLVRVYEWICILCGLKLLDGGEPVRALEEILRASTVPACFNEGRNSHAFLSHIYWFAGIAAIACSQMDEAEKLHRKACEGPNFLTDLACYKGKTLWVTGRKTEAEALFNEMVVAGALLVKKDGRYDHFATGVPTPAPFEGDRGQRNRSEGLLLEALGHAGLGADQQSSDELREVLAIQANHLGAWIFAGKCGIDILHRLK